jgi:hypothetical protein
MSFSPLAHRPVCVRRNGRGQGRGRGQEERGRGSYVVCSSVAFLQGDQIGRIFAHGVIVYLGQLF